MAMKLASHDNSLAPKVRRAGAMSASRLLKFTLGWSITLCGAVLLITDVSATTTPLLHSLADAIRRAIA
jgi:hypothetical protein